MENYHREDLEYRLFTKALLENINWNEILSGEAPPLPAFRKYSLHALHHKKGLYFESDFENPSAHMFECFFDFNQLLQESIMVNIGVDTGDSNMDYTANTVPPAYDADHSLQESEWCASIVWLTKQKRHKKGELYFALDHIKHNPELIHTELMASIANEVWNTLSIFTHLFFFVKMSVYDLLLLNTLLQWHHKTGKWGGSILINKEATTGFYSPDVGSSSATDIKLEKEVKLPVKYISENLPDFAYKYPMSEIFDSTSLWDNGRVTYMSLPKHFRMCMEDYGFSPLKKNVRQNIDNI